jgi:RHS repeat-associated protein
MLAGSEVGRHSSDPSYGIYAYTAREWDPQINLYFYRARYYDPKIGRFISEDPIGFKGGKNLYTYAWNRPIRFRDSLGLCPQEDDCFFYWVIVCWGCECFEWYVPSVQCPRDDFHKTSKKKDVSPRYPYCHDSHFDPNDPDSGYYDVQMTPEAKPGNGPRETPWDTAKVPEPPAIDVEIPEDDPSASPDGPSGR